MSLDGIQVNPGEITYSVAVVADFDDEVVLA